MIKILIIEDDVLISQLIKNNLINVGYNCTCAYDGSEAADIIEHESFDLALVDIMLPGIDGFELMEYMDACKIPVIFLTAKSSVNDKVKGLNLGAEDYITKPFETLELLARVDRVLKRYNKNKKFLHIKDITVDVSSRKVLKGNTEIVLTKKEFDILLLFARNKNIALFRQQIYENVWNEEYLGDSRTIDLHIQRLRKKLDMKDILVSVFKIGYRLEVD